jgi:hypothetical protein
VNKSALVILIALAAACGSPDDGTAVKPGQKATSTTSTVEGNTGATSTSGPVADAPAGTTSTTGATKPKAQPITTPDGQMTTTTASAGGPGNTATTTPQPKASTTTRPPAPTTTGPPYGGQQSNCFENDRGGYQCSVGPTR